MRLTVLGSGTSVPHPRRASSSHWLETSGGTIMLDCSAPAVHRAAEEGCDWAALDAVWISHFHLDHVGGLARLLGASFDCSARAHLAARQVQDARPVA